MDFAGHICNRCEKLVTSDSHVCTPGAGKDLRNGIKRPFVFRFTLAENGCWNWVGSFSSGGRYGSLSWNGRAWNAHRAAWVEVNGEIPTGMCVCHKCDNTKCINPDHLFLGTAADNIQDAAAKGRTARGEKSAHAKLTEQAVAEIKVAYKLGEARQKIADRYGVTAKTVHRIGTGQSWAWLTPTRLGKPSEELTADLQAA